MNILLVGNSMSATIMKMEKEIDNFNGLVARFNAYKTKGFEEYVGTRTDVWITCGIFRRNMLRKYKEILLMSTLLNDQEDKNYAILKKQYPEVERVRYETVYATKQLMRYNMPSTGAVALIHYMMKGYKVFLYGFNFMIDNQPHHYCDNIEKGPNHEPEKEWVFFNNYLASGKVDFLGWDREEQSTPMVRIPKKCGNTTISEYRESTQLGWYNWIARECINKTVLDVGCGLGNGKKLLEQAPGSKVYGVDEDPNLDKIVNNYIYGLKNVKDRYDIVVCVDVIEHVMNDIEFFNRIYKRSKYKLFITTPNFSRSLAKNEAHCRELTISQFINIFKPSELWVASPDGWFNLQKLYFNKKEIQPLDKYWNDNSVDDLEWAHMCGVWA
jgi:2-polyprenyl-3-methyl-5-hydroxy-6-metoxy-1,4-benzoquinol methylase